MPTSTNHKYNGASKVAVLSFEEDNLIQPRNVFSEKKVLQPFPIIWELRVQLLIMLVLSFTIPICLSISSLAGNTWTMLGVIPSIVYVFFIWLKMESRLKTLK